MSSAETRSKGRSGVRLGLQPYLQMARPDHWFKNIFVLPGAVLAVFFQPELARRESLLPLILVLVATSLVASSNYVINELLDAPSDREHPVKRHRPAASGLVRPAAAYLLWLLLAILGISLAWSVTVYAGLAAAALWIMGIIYNIPPLRSKEIPYLDVISESINNPIRLLLGWFALIDNSFPPVSLAIAYWMIGAFFMAIKRFAEYRRIGDAAAAGRYRKSFVHYDEDRLLGSLFFFAMVGALFTGVFIVRYHLELILAIPLVAGFLTWYLRIGLQDDSPVQHPEQLYREWHFVSYALLCAAVFLALMFTHVPVLYDWFNVELSKASPLWTLE
jgi:4-hydroxybenzoate polyprenyltransferase